MPPASSCAHQARACSPLGGWPLTRSASAMEWTGMGEWYRGREPTSKGACGLGTKFAAQPLREQDSEGKDKGDRAGGKPDVEVCIGVVDGVMAQAVPGEQRDDSRKSCGKKGKEARSQREQQRGQDAEALERAEKPAAALRLSGVHGQPRFQCSAA